MNPYATLGVNRDATAGDIDKAYRSKARKHHPDRKGGNSQSFKLIVAAYEILSDDGKREYYDRTGEIPDRKRSQSKVESAIAAVLIDAFCQDRVDPIRWMNEHFDQHRAKCKDAKINCERLRSKLAKRLSTFAKANKKTNNTTGRDFISEVLEARIAEIDRGIEQANADIEHYTEVMTFLNDLKAEDFDDTLARHSKRMHFGVDYGSPNTSYSAWFTP